MIVLDLSILNQKGTPMFNSDIFANRPAFGIVGRIFISTDTAAIYRDTGTAWDLIADGGSASTNIYNSNGTLSANRVVSDGGFGLSFTPTTHIGTAAIGGGGSGKLIVGSSTADNGIQIFGANAPSLRIDNAQSGGTQRFVFGLATATNNFIQGATVGEFCISTQSAGNMLFGMWQTTNASEVMRITTTNNLLIGSSVDNGNRLQVTGNGYFSGNLGIGITPTNNLDVFSTTDCVIQSKTNSTSNQSLIINSDSAGSYSALNIWGTTVGGTFFSGLTRAGSAGVQIAGATNLSFFRVIPNIPIIFGNADTERFRVATGGNLLVGTTTDAGQKLQVNGTSLISGILSCTNQYLFFGQQSGSDSNVYIQSGYDSVNKFVTQLRSDFFGAFSIGTTLLTIANAPNTGTYTSRLSFALSGDATFSSSINIGNSVSAAVAAPSTHKVAILIGGVQYYLLASNV